MYNGCTVFKTVDFISKKWSILILFSLYKGNNKKKRYSELKQDLDDISPKILSLRLKELELNGLIKKEIDSSFVPIKCEYSLTKSGVDFIKIIKDIKIWALNHRIKNDACKNSNCEKCKL